MRRSPLAILITAAFILMAAGGTRFIHHAVDHGCVAHAPAATVKASHDSCGHHHHDHAHTSDADPGQGQQQQHNHNHNHKPSSPDDCDLCDLIAATVTTAPDDQPTIIGDAPVVVGHVLAAAEAAVSRRLDRPTSRGPPAPLA